jgi:hypothetical protein
MAAEAKKNGQFNLKTEDGVDDILEYVVNGIADNSLTRSQADPINTAVKQKLNLVRLKNKWLEMYFNVNRQRIQTGEMEVDEVIQKLPAFFHDTK